MQVPPLSAAIKACQMWLYLQTTVVLPLFRNGASFYFGLCWLKGEVPTLTQQFGKPGELLVMNGMSNKFKFVFILQKCIFEWSHLLVADIFQKCRIFCIAFGKKATPMRQPWSLQVKFWSQRSQRFPLIWTGIHPPSWVTLKDLLLLTCLFNLCISSGIWNPLSDMNKLNSNFRRMEIQKTKPTWPLQGSENAPPTYSASVGSYGKDAKDNPCALLLWKCEINIVIL